MAIIEFNDRITARNREITLILCKEDGRLFRFRGKDINDVCAVVGKDHTKEGKWSNDTYRLVLRPSTQALEIREDWENGKFFPQNTWEEVLLFFLSKGFKTNMVFVMELLTDEFPTAAEQFEKTAAALVEFDEVRPVEVELDDLEELRTDLESQNSLAVRGLREEFEKRIKQLNESQSISKGAWDALDALK